MKQTKNTAFTLVELIVVITILAVLATVAFISFQGYTSSTRDSVRLSDLKNVEKQLNIHFTQKNIYPDPGNAVAIPSGGSQGVLDKSVTNQIGISEVQDPLTKDSYFYRISENKRKYQLLGFLENSDSITFSPLGSTFANNDIPFSKGDKLGIVLNADGKTLPTSIDLSTGTYDVIFSSDTQENLSDVSGEDNFVVLKSSDKGFFDESLVGYWDMETFTSDGRLADLSGNNNHGTINDANNSGLATPVGGALVFDGVDDYVEVNESPEFDFGIDDDFTISFLTSYSPDGRTQQFLAKGLTTTYPFKCEFRLSEDIIYCAIYDGTNMKDLYLKKTIGENKKVYITFLKEGNMIQIYMNGELHDKTNIENYGEIENNINLFFGARSGGSYPLKGTLDEIIIFNRALSQAEINDTYTQIQ